MKIRTPSCQELIKQIVEELLIGDAFTQFNLEDVDWRGLERAVIEEVYNKNSNIDLIKEAVIDLFDSVGYEEFGVEEKKNIKLRENIRENKVKMTNKR